MPKKKKKSKKFDKYYELYLKIILITPFVTLPIGSLFVFLYKPIAAFFGIIIMMCLALFVITVIITIIVQKILTLTRKYKDEDYTLDMFKTKLGKPYKYKFTFTTYNELIDYLLPRAKKKWYEYNCIKIKNKNTHIFERKITDYNRMNYNNFFVFYNTNKLSKELMDEIKNKVDIFIEENYGYTRRPNNIMFVIAVKEPNEYYNKL